MCTDRTGHDYMDGNVITIGPWMDLTIMNKIPTYPNIFYHETLNRSVCFLALCKNVLDTGQHRLTLSIMLALSHYGF